jgi:hypothetical protein
MFKKAIISFLNGSSEKENRNNPKDDEWNTISVFVEEIVREHSTMLMNKRLKMAGEFKTPSHEKKGFDEWFFEKGNFANNVIRPRVVHSSGELKFYKIVKKIYFRPDKEHRSFRAEEWVEDIIDSVTSGYYAEGSK